MEQITVKQARILADLTQAKTAKALGVTLPTYRHYEQNPDSMTIAKAKLFCKVVGKPIDSIFFDSKSS